MNIIVKENKIKPIVFNLEEIRNNLTIELDKYKNLVVTEESVSSGKSTRASLNGLKKQIKDAQSKVKKEQMLPFEVFKKKTDELIKMIDEPVYLIDSQIKGYEEKQKEEKRELIFEYWKGLDLFGLQEARDIDCVFRNEWLNKAITIKKVKAELDVFADKFKADYELLSDTLKDSDNKDLLLEHYVKTLSLSNTLTKKKELEELAKRQEEARQARELENKRQEEANQSREAEVKKQEDAKPIELEKKSQPVGLEESLHYAKEGESQNEDIAQEFGLHYTKNVFEIKYIKAILKAETKHKILNLFKEENIEFEISDEPIK